MKVASGVSFVCNFGAHVGARISVQIGAEVGICGDGGVLSSSPAVSTAGGDLIGGTKWAVLDEVASILEWPGLKVGDLLGELLKKPPALFPLLLQCVTFLPAHSRMVWRANGHRLYPPYPRCPLGTCAR